MGHFLVHFAFVFTGLTIFQSMRYYFTSVLMFKAVHGIKARSGHTATEKRETRNEERETRNEKSDGAVTPPPRNEKRETAAYRPIVSVVRSLLTAISTPIYWTSRISLSALVASMTACRRR